MPRSHVSQKCCGSPTSRASRSARVVVGFGTAVLPRRRIAVMSRHDCASRNGLATIASTATLSVGKKSTTAARASSRLQSARSGVARRRAERVATIVSLSLRCRGAIYQRSALFAHIYRLRPFTALASCKTLASLFKAGRSAARKQSYEAKGCRRTQRSASRESSPPRRRHATHGCLRRAAHRLWAARHRCGASTPLVDWVATTSVKTAHAARACVSGRCRAASSSSRARRSPPPRSRSCPSARTRPTILGAQCVRGCWGSVSTPAKRTSARRAKGPMRVCVTCRATTALLICLQCLLLRTHLLHNSLLHIYLRDDLQEDQQLWT